jgi:hypothetical protein
MRFYVMVVLTVQHESVTVHLYSAVKNLNEFIQKTMKRDSTIFC